MEYNLVIVPPGGGEADFSQKVRGATHVPQTGEYVVIAVEDEKDEGMNGAEAYLVRYAITNLKRQGWETATNIRTTVEAEPVRHPYQSKRHGDMCDRYDGHGGHPTKSFPESGY